MQDAVADQVQAVQIDEAESKTCCVHRFFSLFYPRDCSAPCPATSSPLPNIVLISITRFGRRLSACTTLSDACPRPTNTLSSFYLQKVFSAGIPTCASLMQYGVQLPRSYISTRTVPNLFWHCIVNTASGTQGLYFCFFPSSLWLVFFHFIRFHGQTISSSSDFLPCSSWRGRQENPHATEEAASD